MPQQEIVDEPAKISESKNIFFNFFKRRANDDVKSGRSSYQQRYFFGIFLYFIVGTALGVLVEAGLNAAHFNPHIATLPIIGVLTLSNVIYAAILLALLILMLKLNMIPTQISQQAKKPSRYKQGVKRPRIKAASGDHDEAYEMVRYEQKLQRKRKKR